MKVSEALSMAGERGRLTAASDRALLVAWGELLGAAPNKQRAWSLFRVEQEVKARGLTFALQEGRHGGLEVANVFGGITYALPAINFFRMENLVPPTIYHRGAWLFLVNNLQGG